MTLVDYGRHILAYMGMIEKSACELESDCTLGKSLNIFAS
jgi:hypothetical protein